MPCCTIHTKILPRCICSTCPHPRKCLKRHLSSLLIHRKSTPKPHSVRLLSSATSLQHLLQARKINHTRLRTCHQGTERHTKESKRIFCAMFLQKVAIKFCRNIKTYYLCTRNTETRLAKRGRTLQKAHWTLSSAGSERLPYKQRVGGSNPSASTGNTMEWLLSSTE